MSGRIGDFGARGGVLTAKLLRQEYRYHKCRKAFLKFCWRHFDLVSGCNFGLKTLLLQGLSEPEFCGDFVCGFGRMVGRCDFPCRVGMKIVYYINIGYAMDVLRQAACLVNGPDGVGGCACLFGCAAVGRASGWVAVPSWT